MAVRRLVAPLAVFALGATLVRGEVIDRVLAVVDGHLITLSDARTVRGLGLLAADAPTAPVAADADPVVEGLVDRVLVLQEVERYAPTPPDQKTVDAEVERVTKRIGSPAALSAGLRRLGASDAWLRQWVVDDLRIQAYIAQRFSGAVQPTDEDLENYFREHPAQPGAGEPEAAVQEAARIQIIAARRKALLAEWVTGLRKRADITRPAGH